MQPLKRFVANLFASLSPAVAIWIALLASIALAQPEASPVVPDVITPLINDPQVIDASKAIYNGFVNKQWGFVGFAFLIILVSMVRHFGRRVSPKLGVFLDNPIVAWLLPTAISMLGAVLGSLLAGQPIQAALLAGVNTAALAIATFVGVKKVQEAKANGRAAALAQVLDKAAALRVLERGP